MGIQFLAMEAIEFCLSAPGNSERIGAGEGQIVIFPCELLRRQRPIRRLAIWTIACGRELGVACGFFNDLIGSEGCAS